jgi:hypothetical protein
LEGLSEEVILEHLWRNGFVVGEAATKKISPKCLSDEVAEREGVRLTNSALYLTKASSSKN